MRPPEQHRHSARGPVRVALVTVSDTRSLETDESGALAQSVLLEAGHVVSSRTLVPDEAEAVRRVVERALDEGAEVVITNGGTGIATRDRTFEALDGLLEKRLTGFGELFRSLSFAEIGPAAMLSRATAGTARGGVVIVLPGSPDAVRLALERLVLPELGHLARLAARPRDEHTRSEPCVPSEPGARSEPDAAREADTGTLTHLDAKGEARMVDVGGKPETRREASAHAFVTMSAEAFARLETSKKGDVLAVARVAGVQAAKRTSELIPLCHPVALSSVSIELEPDAVRCGVRVVATARCEGRTGVEMEAMVAASVAALTLYDMLKAVDRGMSIGEVALRSKSGGKSGDYRR
jgi:cyclic pyranopterin phosphate synthase